MKKSKANSTIEYKFQEAFIKLSTQGWSIDRIAQKLNVSKKTLDKWSKEPLSHTSPQTPRITSRHLNNKLNTTRKYNRNLVVNPEPGKRRLQMEYHDYVKQIEKAPTKKKEEVLSDMTKRMTEPNSRRGVKEMPKFTEILSRLPASKIREIENLLKNRVLRKTFESARDENELLELLIIEKKIAKKVAKLKPEFRAQEAGRLRGIYYSTKKREDVFDRHNLVVYGGAWESNRRRH